MRTRKPLAIFCLGLILCQVGGYYGIMEALKNQLASRTAQRIVTEKEPIGGQLILRIPVTSEVANSNEYNVGDSHFTFEGAAYQVIDRHVYDNTLYIVCMRDQQVTDAQESIESFVQSLTGKPGEQGTNVKFFENLSKYFCSEQYSGVTVATGWTLEQPFGRSESFYSFNEKKGLFHPPSAC